MSDPPGETNPDQTDSNATKKELKRAKTLSHLYQFEWKQKGHVFRFFPTHDVMKSAWCGKEDLEFWGMQTWPAPIATFQLAHTAVWRGSLGARPKRNVTGTTFGSDKYRVAERSKYGSYYTWQLAMDV